MMQGNFTPGTLSHSFEMIERLTRQNDDLKKEKDIWSQKEQSLENIVADLRRKLEREEKIRKELQEKLLDERANHDNVGLQQSARFDDMKAQLEESKTKLRKEEELHRDVRLHAASRDAELKSKESIILELHNRLASNEYKLKEMEAKYLKELQRVTKTARDTIDEYLMKNQSKNTLQNIAENDVFSRANLLSASMTKPSTMKVPSSYGYKSQSDGNGNTTGLDLSTQQDNSLLKTQLSAVKENCLHKDKEIEKLKKHIDHLDNVMEEQMNNIKTLSSSNAAKTESLLDTRDLQDEIVRLEERNRLLEKLCRAMKRSLTNRMGKVILDSERIKENESKLIHALNVNSKLKKEVRTLCHLYRDTLKALKREKIESDLVTTQLQRLAFLVEKQFKIDNVLRTTETIFDGSKSAESEKTFTPTYYYTRNIDKKRAPNTEKGSKHVQVTSPKNQKLEKDALEIGKRTTIDINRNQVDISDDESLSLVDIEEDLDQIIKIEKDGKIMVKDPIVDSIIQRKNERREKELLIRTYLKKQEELGEKLKLSMQNQLQGVETGSETSLRAIQRDSVISVDNNEVHRDNTANEKEREVEEEATNSTLKDKITPVDLHEINNHFVEERAPRAWEIIFPAGNETIIRPQPPRKRLGLGKYTSSEVF